MKILKLTLVLCTSLLFFNCASILNGKKQSVYLNTNSAKSTVFVNNEEVGKGSSIKTKLLRNGSVQQIRIEEEGFKDEFRVVSQSRKSPLYIMSWVPFAILLYPPFYDIGNKSFDYSKSIDLTTKKTKILKRTDEQKFVVLEATAFDVKKEDLKYRVIKKRNFNNNKEKFKSTETAKEDINFDNSTFTNSINSILLKYNYVDTTRALLKSNVKYLHIKSNIKKIDLQQVTDKIGHFNLSYLVTKTEIEWEILDVYNQSKFKKIIKSQSGEFSLFGEANKDKNPVYISTEDAITKSFLDFIATKEVVGLMKIKDEIEKKESLLSIKKPIAINSLEDALSATVTIKNSLGHGSGCIISNDGYIVTNFHVVAEEKKALTIIDRNGKEYKGTLIRKNEKNDLALIKVEGSFTKAFTLPKVKNYTIGDEIFVVGTPKSIELGQTLSKGIISGLRKSEETNYIQTDASINGGNSGGSIVSKTGMFLEVVNSKILGTGVEGLGFGSPAEEIGTSLQITQ